MEDNFSMEWNRNGMEESRQYWIWENGFLFHFIPCPVDNTSQIK